MFLLFEAHADNVALDVSKRDNALLVVDGQGGDLILMVVEVIFIVDHVSDVPEGLDGAVPGG